MYINPATKLQILLKVHTIESPQNPTSFLTAHTENTHMYCSREGTKHSPVGRHRSVQGTLKCPESEGSQRQRVWQHMLPWLLWLHHKRPTQGHACLPWGRWRVPHWCIWSWKRWGGLGWLINALWLYKPKRMRLKVKSGWFWLNTNLYTSWT